MKRTKKKKRSAAPAKPVDRNTRTANQVTVASSAVRSDQFAWYVQVISLFLPVLLTFFYVRSFSVEIPMYDDWDLFVPHFHNLAAGNLQWSDINSQHNESLVAFPVAASLVLAKLTGGRLMAVTYLSYLFLCCALGMLFLFFRMLHLPGRWSAPLFLPASLLFLGWRQSDSLLWGTQLPNTMALFFVLAALYCCLQVRRGPIFFAAAMVCAWIASFSMVSGSFVWLLGVPALATGGWDGASLQSTVRRVAGWLLLGGVCATLFILDFRPYTVGWPTGVSFVQQHPLDAARYAFIYLGAPLSATPRQALFAGMALALIALATASLAWRKALQTDGIIPALLLTSYVGVALVALLGRRLGLGIEQGFAPRYVTMGALAPIGVYFCLLGLARRVRACRYLAVGMLSLLVFGIFNSYLSGLADGRTEWARRTACAEVLKNFRKVDHSRLLCTYPDPGIVLDRAPLLEQYQLSLFRR